MLEDAYANPSHASVLRPVRGPMLGLAAAVVLQTALWASDSSLTLPFSIVLLGGLLGLVLTIAIRLLFPPPSKSRRGPI